MALFPKQRKDTITAFALSSRSRIEKLCTGAIIWTHWQLCYLSKKIDKYFNQSITRSQEIKVLKARLISGPTSCLAPGHLTSILIRDNVQMSAISCRKMQVHVLKKGVLTGRRFPPKGQFLFVARRTGLYFLLRLPVRLPLMVQRQSSSVPILISWRSLCHHH
jgi:hypothetical protein